MTPSPTNQSVSHGPVAVLLPVIVAVVTHSHFQDVLCNPKTKIDSSSSLTGFPVNLKVWLPSPHYWGRRSYFELDR